MRRATLNAIYFYIAVVALAALAAFLLEAWRNPASGAYWHVAALVGSIIVAAGWIVTSENTVRNNARQHTIAVLLKHDEEDANKRWKLINQALPGDSVLGMDCMLIETKQTWAELYDAVDLQINTYEFIAMGIVEEVFDEPMMLNTYRNDFLSMYNLAEPYIANARAGVNSTDVWDNFCEVCVKWQSLQPTGGRRNLFSMFANLNES